MLWNRPKRILFSARLSDNEHTQVEVRSNSDLLPNFLRQIGFSNESINDW